jgi:biopolymer transport protein ExbB
MSTKRIMIRGVLVAALLAAGSFTALWAQEPAPAEPAPAAKEMTLLGLIKVGGWAMWPLGLCSFAMITMAAVNFQKVSQKRLIPPDALAQIRAAAAQQDLAKVWKVARATPSLFTTSLAAGLRHLDPEDPIGSKPRVEEAIGETVGRQEAQVGFWINFLSLISAVSPMIGLLGTVSGMIGAFQKIGAGGMGKPELLASNIGEALITTATGLVIAIPAMFFFFFFRNSLNRMVQRAEELFTEVLDELTGSGVSQMEEEEEVEEAEEETAPAPKAARAAKKSAAENA